MLLGLVLILRRGVSVLIVVTVPRRRAVCALSKDLIEGTCHLFAVIKVMHGLSDKLAYLVSLADDDDGITWLRPRHELIDGRGARISFTNIPAWVGLTGSLDDSGSDRGWVFGTGTVSYTHLTLPTKA